MIDRSELIIRMELADRLASLAQAQLRVARISQDDSMIMFHQGYLSAIEDIARSVGLGAPIRAEHLPVVGKLGRSR